MLKGVAIALSLVVSLGAVAGVRAVSQARDRAGAIDCLRQRSVAISGVHDLPEPLWLKRLNPYLLSFSDEERVTYFDGTPAAREFGWRHVYGMAVTAPSIAARQREEAIYIKHVTAVRTPRLHVQIEAHGRSFVDWESIPNRSSKDRQTVTACLGPTTGVYRLYGSAVG